MNIAELINTYFTAKAQLQEALGYEGNWVEIPMDDVTLVYWMIVGGEEAGGSVVHSLTPFTKESIISGKEIFGSPIYTQRHLPKWVYRTPSHVAVCANTQTDGNKFLMIFDASKECTDDTFRKLYADYWG